MWGHPKYPALYWCWSTDACNMGDDDRACSLYHTSADMLGPAIDNVGPNRSSSPGDRGSTPSIDQTNAVRPKRDKKTPSHLRDYVCYNASLKNTPCSAHPLPKVSSGKPYPIPNYVTCDRFCKVHRCYLINIIEIVEPKFFHEVVKMSSSGRLWQRKLKY